MGRIIGGIGTSHAPSLAHAYDRNLQREPLWAPLFDGYVPVRRWLDAQQPDALIVVYNDHMNRFFFDAYPTFALGVGAVHPQADEGWGKRPFRTFGVTAISVGISRAAWWRTSSIPRSARR